MKSDKAVTLHYIDKLHVLQIESGKKINLYCALCLAVCFFTFFISSGFATADPKLTIIGLNISFPSWVLPLIGTWLILIMYSQLISIVCHESRLRRTILDLYKEIEFEHESMQTRQVNLLEYPNVLTLMTSRENLRLGRMQTAITLTALIIVLIIPLFTQVYASYRMLAGYGGSSWIAVSSVIVIVCMLVYMAAFFRSSSSYENREKKSNIILESDQS